MSGSDSGEFKPDLAEKRDELTENKFVHHCRRTELSVMTEGLFVVLFLALGFIEWIWLEQRVCGESIYS
ncbi:unnamed protein product [Heligmosomoides polygyrus]|uniref:Cation_ATPase_N domain-containing protein n=1 Tax=Heligmosomoides polygyrus TaxID=6339 RepID=A0A183FAC9_HELPZ|nr:unnamed protein product [Heligmosomoides polygyrus]